DGATPPTICSGSWATRVCPIRPYLQPNSRQCCGPYERFLVTDFTHLDELGRARMVDVSDKDVTRREATARSIVSMQPETARLIASGGMAKGDVLAVAQVAGVMAAKRTPDLIPMCHPLPITGVDFAFDLDRAAGRLEIQATVRVTGRTGVEMEALTAAAVAALTVYDMCKAVDRAMSMWH